MARWAEREDGCYTVYGLDDFVAGEVGFRELAERWVEVLERREVELREALDGHDEQTARRIASEAEQAARYRVLRENVGDRTEVAERLGIMAKTISRRERGLTPIRKESALALAYVIWGGGKMENPLNVFGAGHLRDPFVEDREDRPRA